MTSLFRTDTGNFNRFLTSLGLGLVVAAIVVPFFFFRDTQTLRISSSELHGLTTVGREALERRQHRIADLETPMLIFAVFLLIGGCFALFFGGKRLRTAQGKEDAAVDRQARKENYEIDKQTASEVAEGQQAQAIEDAVARRTEEESPGGENQSPEEKPSTDAEPNGAPLGEARTFPAEVGDLARSRGEIARIEEAAQQIFGEESYARFTFFSEVRITTGITAKRRIQLDGLFESKVPTQPDIALELKIVNAPVRSLRSRSVTYADQLLARLTRYAGVTEREALGWLVIVAAGGIDGSGRTQWHATERDIDELLAGLGRCTILAESELNDLPDRFRQIFEV